MTGSWGDTNLHGVHLSDCCYVMNVLFKVSGCLPQLHSSIKEKIGKCSKTVCLNDQCTISKLHTDKIKIHWRSTLPRVTWTAAIFMYLKMFGSYANANLRSRPYTGCVLWATPVQDSKKVVSCSDTHFGPLHSTLRIPQSDCYNKAVLLWSRLLL